MFDKLSNIRTQVTSFGRDQRGAIAVVVALLIPVLAGGLALAIDLSRAANLQTELQDHADAIALSGATQLDNSDGSRERAIQAAAGALALVVNSQRFGDNTETLVDGGITVDSTVNVPVDGIAVNQNIRFYVDLINKVDATTDADANFIEVTISPRRVGYFFAGLVSQIIEANPNARAIAGYDQLLCGIQPMMMCNPNGSLPFDVATQIGAGVWMKTPGSKAEIPGEFGYLQVEGPNGNSTNKSICEALASVNPSPICLGTKIDGKGGNITSLHECVNARVGIYNKQDGWETLSDYQPDVNTVKGLVHDGSNDCDFNPVGLGGGAWDRPDEVGGTAYEPGVDLNLLTTMTYPRDTCAYNAGGCDLDAGQAQVGDGDWAIGDYAFVQHGGISGLNLVAAVVLGVGGVSFDKAPLNTPGLLDNITRKEVYDYEVAINAMVATMSPDATPANVPAVPGCWSGAGLPAGGFLGSRRTMTVAVIDCPDAVPNKKDLPLSEPHGAIDVFIVEPIGGVVPNNFYVEIVGPAGSENLSVIAEERVILYE